MYYLCIEETPPTKPYTDKGAAKFNHTLTPQPYPNSTNSNTMTTPVAHPNPNPNLGKAVPVVKYLFPAESLLVHITDTQVRVHECMYVYF